MSSLTNIRVISQVGFGFIDGCAVTLRSRLFLVVSLPWEPGCNPRGYDPEKLRNTSTALKDAKRKSLIYIGC